ncbi:MAG: NfeD family protein [Gemmatimonadaceae bacterium]
MRQSRSTHRGRRRCALLGIALLALAGGAGDVAAQARRLVYVIPIEGMIDMGLVPFVERTLADAALDSAAAVILEINTFGGRVDAAVAIRDALLSSRVTTVAFVNRRAISAGALISLAAERIVMANGGTIGAATPVQLGAPGAAPSPVDEKSVSYVRKEFRATADSRKRPPAVAEAMVDADVAIPGLIEKGKLLTLTTDEAIEHKLADFRADDIEGVLAGLGLAGADVRSLAPNWGETIVRLITSPLIASLLLSVAMLGILMEIRTPGFGVPGALGVASLVLLLGGHWIVQLVGWEEILLVGIGLVLIAVEVLVIPGFGVAGVVGFIGVLAGLTMGMVGHGPSAASIAAALGRVAFSMVVALAASLVLMRYLPRLPVGRQLLLDTALASGGGYASAPVADHGWLGRTGRATTPLRPAGIMEIDGTRVDVVSDGEMIETGATIVVSRVDGNRVVVRRHHAVMDGSKES